MAVEVTSDNRAPSDERVLDSYSIRLRSISIDASRRTPNCNGLPFHSPVTEALTKPNP